VWILSGYVVSLTTLLAVQTLKDTWVKEKLESILKKAALSWKLPGGSEGCQKVDLLG
jgi:hypothetical protein